MKDLICPGGDSVKAKMEVVNSLQMCLPGGWSTGARPGR